MKIAKRLGIAVLITCLSAPLFSCGLFGEEEETEVVTTKLEVETIQPSTADIELTREFVGTVQADTETNVIPLAEGEITKMLFEVGDVVQEGDLMLTLDDQDARLSVAQAEAGLQTSKAGLAAAQAASEAAKAAKTASDAQIQESLNQAVTESQEMAANAQDAADAVKAAEYARNLANQSYDNADSHIHDYNRRRDYLEDKIKELDGQVNELSNGPDAADPRVQGEIAALEANVDALKSELDVVKTEYSKDDLILERYQAAITQITSGYDLESAKRAKEIADKVLSDYINFSIGRAVADAQAQAAAADAEVQSSAAAVNEAAAGVTGAEADMDSAKLSLDRTQVVAPVSGVVTAKYLKEHDTAGDGEAAYVISSADSVNVTFYCTEEMQKLLAPGQKTLIKKGDEEFEGNVVFISQVLDEETGLFKVKSSISGRASDFVKGTTVKIDTGAEKAKGVLTLPIDAVRYEDRQAYVFVARDGKAIRTDVAVGLIGDQEAEIKEGINPEDQVILSRSSLLRNGSEIRVIKTAEVKEDDKEGAKDE